MAQYKFSQFMNIDSARAAILVVPLSIITLFCFSFVLMQPSGTQKSDNVSSNKSASESGYRSNASAEAEKLPKLNTLTPPTSGQGLSQDWSAVVPNTVTSTARPMTDLQAVMPNPNQTSNLGNGSIPPSASISIQLTQPVNNLLTP